MKQLPKATAAEARHGSLRSWQAGLRGYTPPSAPATVLSQARKILPNQVYPTPTQAQVHSCEAILHTTVCRFPETSNIQASPWGQEIHRRAGGTGLISAQPVPHAGAT